jgi:hypothetical protein
MSAASVKAGKTRYAVARTMLFNDANTPSQSKTYFLSLGHPEKD